MLLLGQMALVAGVLASFIVQYRFYVVRDRSQTTFIILTAANFLLLAASRALGLALPLLVSGLLWAGFLFSLAVAVFHDQLPLGDPK